MSAKTGHVRIVWTSAASVNNASALGLLFLLSAQAPATTTRAPLVPTSDSAPPAAGGAAAAFAVNLGRAAGGIAAQAQWVFSRKRATGRARKRASVASRKRKTRRWGTVAVLKLGGGAAAG